VAARSGRMKVLQYLHKLDAVFGQDWTGNVSHTPFFLPPFSLVCGKLTDPDPDPDPSVD
jgi:hypothetical protein